MYLTSLESPLLLLISSLTAHTLHTARPEMTPQSTPYTPIPVLEDTMVSTYFPIQQLANQPRLTSMWRLQAHHRHQRLLRPSRSRPPNQLHQAPMQRVHETRSARPLHPLRIRRLRRRILPQRPGRERLPRHLRFNIQPAVPLQLPLRHLGRRHHAVRQPNCQRFRKRHASQSRRHGRKLQLLGWLLQLLPAAVVPGVCCAGVLQYVAA